MRYEYKVSVSTSYGDGRRMHWLYFLLIGWWLGSMVACLLLPLIVESGRRFVAACYGYW